MNFDSVNLVIIYLQWLQEEYAGKEGDEDRGQPLVGLVRPEADRVLAQEVDGEDQEYQAKDPSDPAEHPRDRILQAVALKSKPDIVENP